ncbi:hypothetical protein [Dyadobacter frigoris]|nr:hypothetical protein [Dyadobacter frigoris]GLU51693.1 hypothetical protein Dfri01_11540 [Dyadobacter frigoris]
MEKASQSKVNGKKVSLTLVNPYSAGIDISDKEHDLFVEANFLKLAD